MIAKNVSLDLRYISLVTSGTRDYLSAVYGSLLIASVRALSIHLALKSWVNFSFFCFVGSFCFKDMTINLCLW